MTEPSAVPTEPAASAPVTPAAPAPSTPAAPADPWATFTPPEGFDNEHLKEIVGFAKQHEISPKAAAALALREKARAEKEDAEFKQLSEKGWLDELTADPELGGANIRETMVDAMRAHDKLPSSVQAMIKDSGSLYNPLLVRVLNAFGKNFLREDTYVRPGATPQVAPPRPAFERLAAALSREQA